MKQVYVKLNQNEIARIIIFLFLVFSLILTSVFYIFSISWGIKEIAHKQEKAREFKLLEEENKILESKLASLFKKLDLDYAYNTGFVDAQNSVHFAAKVKAVAKAR